jgi:hypothetical protein
MAFLLTARDETSSIPGPNRTGSRYLQFQILLHLKVPNLAWLGRRLDPPPSTIFAVVLDVLRHSTVVNDD